MNITIWIILGLLISSCTRDVGNRSEIRFSIPSADKLNAKRMTTTFNRATKMVNVSQSTSAPQTYLMHLVLNVQGPDFKKIMHWDACEGVTGECPSPDAPPKLPPTQFLISEVPQGPNTIVQALIVQEATDGTTAFYYGDKIENILGSSMNLTLTLSSLFAGDVKFGRVAGRYLLADGTGPTGIVEVLFQPPSQGVQIPPMTLMKTEMIAGWLEVFSMSGITLNYKVKTNSGDLLLLDFNLSESTTDPSEKLIQIKVPEPSYFVQSESSGGTQFYRLDQEEYRIGFFGPGSTNKVVCYPEEIQDLNLHQGNHFFGLFLDSFGTQVLSWDPNTIGSSTVGRVGGVPMSDTRCSESLFSENLKIDLNSLITRGVQGVVGTDGIFKNIGTGSQTEYLNSQYDGTATVSVNWDVLPDISEHIDGFEIFLLKVSNSGFDLNFNHNKRTCDVLQEGFPSPNYNLISQKTVGSNNTSTQFDSVSPLGTGESFVTVICPYKTSFLSIDLENSGTKFLSSFVSEYVKQAPPPNPNSLTGNNFGLDSVQLNWNSGGGSTIGYRVAYLSGSTPPSNCQSGVTVTAESHTVSPLTANSNHTFRVCALNGNPNPDESIGVTITISTLPSSLNTQTNLVYSGSAGILSHATDFTESFIYFGTTAGGIKHVTRNLQTNGLTASTTANFLSPVNSLVVSDDGHFLYGASTSLEKLVIHPRNLETGALSSPTLITTSSLIQLSTPSQLLIPIDGRQLYVISETADEILVLHRAPDTGLLTFAFEYTDNSGGMDCLDGIKEAKFSDDGRFIYLAAYQEGKICVLARNLATGALSQVQTFVDPNSTTPVFLDIDKSNDVLYAISENPAQVYIFDRDHLTGFLTLRSTLNSGNFFIPQGLKSIRVSPEGHTVYLSSTNQLTLFNRTLADGNLSYRESLLDGTNSTKMTGIEESAITFDDEQIYIIKPSNETIEVFSQTQRFGNIAYNAQQSLARNGLFYPSQDGRHFYSVNNQDYTADTQAGLSAWKTDKETGQFSHIPESDANNPNPYKYCPGNIKCFEFQWVWEIFVSYDGLQVYVVLKHDESIIVFNRNPQTGALTFNQKIDSNTVNAGGVACGGAFNKVMCDPYTITGSRDGKHIYIASSNDAAHLLTFDRNLTDGTLSFASSVYFGTSYSHDTHVRLSRDDRTMYITSYSDWKVFWTSRNVNNGSMAFAGTYNYPGWSWALPGKIVVSPTGQHAFSWGVTKAKIFDANFSTGSLTAISSGPDYHPDLSNFFDISPNSSEAQGGYFLPGEKLFFEITPWDKINLYNYDPTTGVVSYTNQLTMPAAKLGWLINKTPYGHIISGEIILDRTMTP